MALVDSEYLVTIPQVEEMTTIPKNRLYTWVRREHIVPVRDGVPVYDWREIRPIIAEREGLPADSWANVPIP